MGELIWKQTRDRIEDEKTAPDGTPWKPNQAGKPTLYREGNLSRSIEFEPAGSTVAVGSSLIYARIHQLGGEIRPVRADLLKFRKPDGGWVSAKSVTIPARPYLGLSDENRQDIMETTIDFVRRKVLP
ncbi:phage virion morphogenesis protein [Pseudochelatococcus lubricantis]|uniref:phage virion morphogenesis protein n=1 Tax=Pseudochelatococcus lubricantis TaxID=1538102 RepID=UPI00141EE444